MGDFLSKPSEPDSPATMSSPNSDQPNSKNSKPQTLIEKIADPPTDPNTAQIQSEEKPNESIKYGDIKEEGGQEKEKEEEEEEEGECGFCLFMKAGGCEETFTEWEKCVEEGEKNKEDIVEKCFQVTANLKKCMEDHSDYYAPLLEAEKAAEAELANQLEEERESSKKEEEGSGEKEKLGVSDEKKSS